MSKKFHEGWAEVEEKGNAIFFAWEKGMDRVETWRPVERLLQVIPEHYLIEEFRYSSDMYGIGFLN